MEYILPDQAYFLVNFWNCPNQLGNTGKYTVLKAWPTRVSFLILPNWGFWCGLIFIVHCISLLSLQYRHIQSSLGGNLSQISKFNLIDISNCGAGTIYRWQSFCCIFDDCIVIVLITRWNDSDTATVVKLKYILLLESWKQKIRF